MENISQNVWVETDYFGANIGIIKTTEGLILIDTPMNPTDQDLLLQEIKDRELGTISWIIATDHHLDHFMGASFLPGLVISHQAVRGKFLRTFGPIESIVERVSWSDPQGVERIKKLVVKEPAITFDGRLSLFFDPVTIHLEPFVGHTVHTLAVRVEPDGVLFTGDNVVNGMPPFFHEAEQPLEWVDSLKNMKQFPDRIVVPGHGNVTDGSAVDEMLKNIEAVVDLVKEARAQGHSEEKILDDVRYLTTPDRQVDNPNLEDFYRQLEKRGTAHILGALNRE